MSCPDIPAEETLAEWARRVAAEAPPLAPDQVHTIQAALSAARKNEQTPEETD